MMNAKLKIGLGLLVFVIGLILLIHLNKPIENEISSIDLHSSWGQGIASEISISKTDDSISVKKNVKWNNATYYGTIDLEDFEKLEKLILININSWKAEYLTDARDVASDKIMIHFKDGKEKSILVYDFPNEDVPPSLLEAIDIIQKFGESEITFSSGCTDIADLWTNLPQDKKIEECNKILNQQTADLKNIGFEPKDCEVIKAEAKHCTGGMLGTQLVCTYICKK